MSSTLPAKKKKRNNVLFFTIPFKIFSDVILFTGDPNVKNGEQKLPPTIHYIIISQWNYFIYQNNMKSPML